MLRPADSSPDHMQGSVVLHQVPTVVIHHAPHQLQVRLSGDVSADRAAAAAKLVVAALGQPSLVELDLSRVTHIGAEAIDRMASSLAAAAHATDQLLLRARPGPVLRLLEAAGLAEEDGGLASIVAAPTAVRPPDAATEVVMRFYEALTRRDWFGLQGLVADGARWSVPTVEDLSPASGRREIVDFHARAVERIPGLRPAVGSTESDGRNVLARGSHVVPATGGLAAPFRHSWHVAGDRVVAFREQVDAAAYGHLRALHAA